VVVDDASTDDCIDRLVASLPQLLDEPNISIKLCRLSEHSGIYRARNEAAYHATADILFHTDAHVAFCRGWDELVFRHLRPDRILAATIAHEKTSFRGYGCKLVVPFMGTYWNREMKSETMPVHVAACPGTVLTKELFDDLGGYDEGMLFYGAGEPELSIRAWLRGAEVVCVRDLTVRHRFKLKDELANFIAGVRPYWVHNCLRFGLLYLSELGCMQLLRHHLRLFPNVYPRAIAMVEESDVWERRSMLESWWRHSFEWFVERFNLVNQIGDPIL
jgi:glycosyltransferase involved in cell wall biosynthesis